MSASSVNEIKKRKERATTNPICLVDHALVSISNEDDDKDTKDAKDTKDTKDLDNMAIFTIRGSTDYTLQYRINKGWTCSCPDYQRRRKTCKHIFFVLNRVLRHSLDVDVVTDSNDTEYNMKTFSSPQEIISALETRLAGTTGRIQNGSASLAKSSHSPCHSTSSNDVPQRPYLGEDCVICFEAMTDATPVVFCYETCGQSLHAQCFQIYQGHAKNVRCPSCRSELFRYQTNNNKKSKCKR